MAAVVWQSGNNVWQKVRQSLTNANPASAGAFKGLREYFAQQKKNPDLYFLAFGDLGTGLDPDLDGPYQVIGVYGKKQATATDAFLKVQDNTTQLNSIPFLVANDEAVAIYPTGLDISNAVGVLLESHTTSVGTTDSTAGDGPVGFLILAANGSV